MIRLYTTSSNADESSDEVKHPLLWLYVPNLKNEGKIESIKYVPNLSGVGTFWTEDDDCSGKELSDDCEYRATELQVVSYSPPICADDETEECSELRAFARFNIRSDVVSYALRNIGLTLFVGFALALSSFSFNRDSESLVIQPITRMVNIIRKLAEDPLKKPANKDPGQLITQMATTTGNQKSNGPQLGTKILESTILKIRGLLQVGFGEMGAQIIEKQMENEKGELNIMQRGTKISCIFGVCSIRYFLDITDCLQEEVMVFINKIVKIVHTSSKYYKGFPNKNTGETFLLLWRLPNVPDPDGEEEVEEDDQLAPEEVIHTRIELADSSLIAFMKLMVEVRRASDLNAYARHPKIIPRFGGNFKVQLGLGLHMGWAIEGSIGSEIKIDAQYLSPHQDITDTLESITEEYGVNLLISQNHYELLSERGQKYCRKIDCVFFDEAKGPLDLYAVDFSESVLAVGDDHQLGEFVPPNPKTDESGVDYHAVRLREGISYMFEHDQDIATSRPHFEERFFSIFEGLVKAYIDGDWARAYDWLEKCLELSPEDGPTLFLKNFMSLHNFEAPETWQGYRNLLE